jgi:hypothetical protein
MGSVKTIQLVEQVALLSQVLSESVANFKVGSMSMKNVITFPERRSRQTRREQKASVQTALWSLSLVSFMMGALLVNDTVRRSNAPQYLVSDNFQSQDLQRLNRAIASAQPVNPFRDREWEAKIAQRLSQQDRTPASVGKVVSSLDQLRFGPLAGKYRLMDLPGQQESRLQEISYVESVEAQDRPVYLEPSQFLQDYGGLLSIPFAYFDRANHISQDQVREYRLLNAEKQVVGIAAFVMDDEGRFLSLKVRTASKAE